MSPIDLPSTVLFVATERNTLAFRWSGNGKETREFFDDQGARVGCVSTTDRGEFVVGRNEAIYFYGPEGRGACFALEGDKQMIKWFRSYAVIVTLDTRKSSAKTLTLYDLKNKFIAFQETFSAEVAFVQNEWGHLFVFLQDKRVI